MSKLIYFVIFFAFQYVGFCQRRIVKGARTHGQKTYMVYMIKSRESTDAYDSWLCGGALVTTSQIITSAACIVDIDNIYAIAGYRKYVNGRDIDRDNCTRLKKQRIVKIRVPREPVQEDIMELEEDGLDDDAEPVKMTLEQELEMELKREKEHFNKQKPSGPLDYEKVLKKEMSVYETEGVREHIAHVNDYTNTTRWMTLDIGVATVEKPYDLDDISFKIYCSYIPTIIQINYNPRLDEKVGTNVVAFGWGRDKGGKINDVVDRNSETLREVSIKIKHKEHCIHKFQGNGLTEMIQKYMICTHGKGLLDGEGFIIEDNLDKSSNKCMEFDRRREMDECVDDFDDMGVGRRSKTLKEVVNNTIRIDGNKGIQKENASSSRFAPKTRRQGICQNDHGGPLITWVGSTELLIGVAVNSLYDEHFECIGPFLFTSTSAAGQVVRCLLANEHQTRRTCPEAERNGYDIFEKYLKKAQDVLIARMNDGEIVVHENDTESLSSIEVVSL